MSQTRAALTVWSRMGRSAVIAVLILTFVPFAPTSAGAAWPADDAGYPGTPEADIVYGGVWSRAEVMGSIEEYRSYGFDENFAYYSADTVEVVQLAEARAWASNAPMNSTSFLLDGRWWTYVNRLFAVGGTFRSYSNGDSFIAKVSGAHTNHAHNPSPPKILGVKYLDTDLDGVKDLGEAGVSGWRIDLYLAGTLRASTYTNASGAYEFVIDGRAGLPPGTYRVVEEERADWRSTSPTSRFVTIAEGPSSAGRSFGGNNFSGIRLGSIEGFAWSDTNGDGAYAISEPKLAGITLRASMNGTVVAETLTDGSGAYALRLDPGTYQIEQVLRSGWFRTFPVAVPYQTKTLASGAVIRNVNFGSMELAGITPLKVSDLDVDGTWDEGEPLLAGWAMTLASGSGTPYSAPLVTAAVLESAPSWVDLRPGAYVVTPEQRAGWTPAPAQSLSVTSGQHVTLTFMGAELGRIGGEVFEDLDLDGAHDAGEAGIAGWTVELVREGVVVESATSGADGTYDFADVGFGEYVVREAPQSAWMPTVSESSTVTVVPGAQLHVEFGNVQVGDIAGVRVEDVDGDGVAEAGEPPAAGLAVTLSRADGTTVGAPVLTDAEGAYAFNDVPIGDYVLTGEPQDGWYSSAGPTREVTVEAGICCEPEPILDVRYASISGSAFSDADVDDVRDASAEETGLVGWDVALLREAGEGAWSVETTIATCDVGAFCFDRLRPGHYRVELSSAEGWQATCAPTGEFEVLSGGVVEGLEFGAVHLCGLDIAAYDDTDGDGMRDEGEAPVSGRAFEVTGVCVEGTPIEVTVFTDETGVARLDGLLPCDVSVSEALPELRLAPDGSVVEPGWRTTTPDVGSVTIGCGCTQTMAFGSLEYGWIEGRVTHEVYGSGVGGVEVVLEETGETAITDAGGVYRFYRVDPNGTAVCPAAAYLVGMELAGSQWQTSGVFGSVVVVAEGAAGSADFSVFEEGYGNQPSTVSYWKKWDRDYTAADMAAMLATIGAGSAEFDGLQPADVATVLTFDKRSAPRVKARAEFLAFWLNCSSGKLGWSTLVDVSDVANHDAVITAGEDHTTTVIGFLKDVEDAFIANVESLWSTVQALLESLNTGRST